MSIVSDALKKAQRQRQLETATPNVSMGGGRAARLGRPSFGQKLALGAAGLVALIAVAVAVTISFLQPDPEEIAARINAQRAAAQAAVPPPAPLPPVNLPPPPTLPVIEPPVAAANPAPTANAPVRPASPPAAPTPSVAASPVQKAPPATAPASAPTPAPVSGRLGSATAAGTVAIAPAAPTAAVPRAPAAPDPRIQDYVDDLKIVAILSNPDPARNVVKLGDRLYRSNDFVDRAMGLRLVEVGANSLTFSDAAGAIYTKEFRLQ